MEIVSVTDNEIRLDSGMKESSFSKTNYDAIAQEKGMLAVSKNAADFHYNFEFSPWAFSDIQSFLKNGDSERTVFYTAPQSGFSDRARTLSSFLKERSTESFLAGFAVLVALTQCAKEEAQIPINGAGGILIEFTEEEVRLLFMPELLYKYAVNGVDRTAQDELQGYLLNPSLSTLPAICFERSALAYKMLSDRYPFLAAAGAERNADIADKRFIPIEMCVTKIDQILAAEINRGLKLNANSVSIPGKKQKGRASEELSPVPQFPLGLMLDTRNAPTLPLSDEEYKERTKAFVKVQNSTVLTKRKIRRNIGTIIASIAVIIVLLIITANTISNRLDDYTSKGLTSTQTIEAFFKGVNSLDTILLGNITKGKSASRVVDTVSQIYVISKQRQAYSKDFGYLSPEGWLLVSTDAAKASKAGMYGVSNVRIDGKLSSLNPDLKKRKEKPTPITVEKNVTLKNNDKSVHKVEYFVVHTEGENAEIQVDLVQDIITLTYKKDRWIITNIDSDSKDLGLNSSQFKADYFSAYTASGHDAFRAAEMVSIKYPWIPDREVLKREYDKLQDIVKNPLSGL